MALTCEACGEPVATEDIYADRAVAKCRSCDTVFSFARSLPVDDGPGHDDRGEVGRPERMSLEESDSEVVFSWSWFRLSHVFIGLFAVLWDAFILAWYSKLLTDGAPTNELHMNALMFPLVHVGVGIGVTYFAIACLLNRTEIRLTAEQLTVRHGPLPWLGNRELACEDLDQLYCVKRVRHSEHGHSTSYTLNALLHDGRKVSLVRGLPEIEEGAFLEEQIETRLGIPDRHVRGDIRL